MALIKQYTLKFIKQSDGKLLETEIAGMSVNQAQWFTEKGLKNWKDHFCVDTIC